ncbi:uncharacterized protein A1O9_05748 [Exophiala aquamarina CBS 119918]|uniref:Alpha/beta hydrolase fold-3 domain-containing protein n=1 Tax=Exophiala aquamarina CBS 119918 TaxID=1182545 RepID=A0A072PF04_9EURO|nr:uncharacterized protein A1O9_05748 [Exophiala aquamarina CBS 119918]KEF57828.1 hypothetical protein A1O9_05748 [Exophiala aquamarina CBS 119918]
MAAPPTPSQALAPSTHQMSVTEKLDLPLGLASLLGTAIYTAVTSPFRGDSGAYYFGQHVSNAVIRKLVRRFSTLQLQYIGQPFGKIYEKWSQQNNLPTETFQLKSGVKAFWLGDHKAAKYIVIYSHGGGFSLDGDDTHIRFWNTVQDGLKSSNIPIATLFLEYTLVPHATYPTQISEAVEAVNYVLADLKRPASDIILAGDSAGGNMALAILSHLTHPSPDLPPITLSPGDKLKALVLIGPWTSFRTDFPSATRNGFRDLVTVEGGSAWSKDYLGGKETGPYAEALLAPEDWWRDAKVEQLLAVAGADELLIDPINEWFAKYKAANPTSSTLVVAPHETHIQPIIALRFGDTTETEQGKAIKSWLKSKL